LEERMIVVGDWSGEDGITAAAGDCLEEERMMQWSGGYTRTK